MKKIESIDFKRFLTESLSTKLKKHQSFLLLGPRQTGKSTLIEQLMSPLPKSQKLNYYLQLPSTRQALETDPESLVREVDALASTKPITLFIDEIQKVPSLLDVLQFLLDQKKIVLAACGSSARKMKSLGTNWLPGRIALMHLSPLTYSEFQDHASLQEVLRFGALPGILKITDENERSELLRSYTHLYLEEEIRAEAAVRNLPQFSLFLKLAATESGGSPNFSKMGQQIGVAHTTVANYYQVLEDTLTIHRLNAFGHSRAQIIRSPKYYFFDLGVRNSASHVGHSPGILELQKGLLFEHFIVLEAIAHAQDKAQLSYWRTKRGHEVDLIIEQSNSLIAVEIKATKKPTHADFKGLHEFSKQHPCDKTMLVCDIERPQKFDQHLAIPWKMFQAN